MSETIEIGGSVRAGSRRQGASHNMVSEDRMPLAAPIGEEAIKAMPASPTMPPSPIPISDAIPAAAGGEVQGWAVHPNAPDLSATLSAIVELQKQRVFCIKSQSRSDRSCEAFIARYLGYKNELSEKERTAMFKRAAAMRREVEKGGQVQDDNPKAVAPADGEGHQHADDHKARALSVCTPIILNSAAARAAWDSHRNQTEKQMRKLARSLPIWPWVEAVSGFGDLGLAIVVAEAGGDLANYATKERLWKRLGLAVIAGERQQRKAGAELAAAHGYSPRRRAEIWTLADSMFRHQWRGEKDGIAPHPTGRYGEVYAKRKAHTTTREWTPAHRENDARRVMTKALVEDLWKVWRT